MTLGKVGRPKEKERVKAKIVRSTSGHESGNNENIIESTAVITEKRSLL